MQGILAPKLAPNLIHFPPTSKHVRVKRVEWSAAPYISVSECDRRKNAGRLIADISKA